MIFRNDDINPNSNFRDIREMYDIILEVYPDAKIYSCINLLGKTNERGSPYPALFHKDINFTDIDKVFDFSHLENLENIASHGLWHLDHKHVSDDLQRFSILTSCNLLKTKIFIPPFWRWNRYTEKVCRDNDIKLWVNEPWVNLDNLEIGESKFYLFHSWKFTVDEFRKKIKKSNG